ncbi:MAG: hypothetical protein GY822_25040 [Deltaproteobacteria bacterium]|nr:hypothetical protein [Deltaproteobacteria bacterium]
MLHSSMPFQKSMVSIHLRKNVKWMLLLMCCGFFAGVEKDEGSAPFDANLFLEVHPSPNISATQVAKLTLLGLAFSDVTDRNAGLRAAFRLSMGEMGPLRGVHALEEALALPVYAPFRDASSTIALSSLQKSFDLGGFYDGKAVGYWVRVQSPSSMQNAGSEAKSPYSAQFFKMKINVDHRGVWRVRSIEAASAKETKKALQATYTDVVKDEFPLENCFEKLALGDIHAG